MTVPKPAMKKNSVSRSNDDFEGSVISSGVLAISRAKAPKPVENRIEDANEHDHGPYLSIAFPTRAAKGYWPIIPLHAVEQLDWAWYSNFDTHASTIVVNCG